MPAQQKAKAAKDRGVRNGMRRSGKAYKKGSIHNGVKGAKFDENGVRLDPATGRPWSEVRAERRRNRPKVPTSYAEVVDKYNAAVEAGKEKVS